MFADLSVSLWRGAKEGRYETYSVPRRESQTVLDVVTFVQRNIDPTLSYRFACRVGVCGSCAMTVNGKPRWTCRTHVSKVAGSGRLEVGPLENLTIIKDLAVLAQDRAPIVVAQTLVGIEIVAPRSASDTVIGTSTWRSSPSRR